MERASAQRRTVGVLVGSQILGGTGLAAGIAVGSLLAAQLSGSDALSGLGGTVQVLGAAIAAIPIASVTSRLGRRFGLVLGYLVGAIGAALVVASGMAGSFPLLLVGFALLGAGTASSSASRYAAADLATAQHRGRDLSIVVWATTIGSVLGPNVLSFSPGVARALSIPTLTAPLALSLVCFILASGLLWVLLRPDPLLLARDLSDEGMGARVSGSVAAGFGFIRRSPTALTGVITMAIGHAVMVGLMVMTPIHMNHGGASLEVIGLVISLHILGMYGFSPFVGMAVDRAGARLIGLLGILTQVIAGALAAGSQQGQSWTLTTGLVLLGLGWAATFISGSTMLVQAIEVVHRPAAQGSADLVMGLGAAAAGGLAGVVVQFWGFAQLGLLGGALCLISAVRLFWPLRRGGTN
ncbi:MAG TPA: MFS transporter [Marmoricola sp.]|nr:MFS transporter [Marmoricola sp.]